MLFDEHETAAALRAWFKPNEVFEVRVLEATTKQWSTKPHTEAGYFDLAHLPELFRALATLTSYKGVYVTLNPLTPAVLGRARYAFKHDKLIGAKDEEVLCRRWLPIDCDAKRVSGVPSSDDEHAHALAKARFIRDGFASKDWPEPLFIDSGNGAQLLYRLPDLPPSSDLVKRCLEKLAVHSDERVEIDQTVFNPARIWRLPGTWNRKGDACPEQGRVHRPSRILALPAWNDNDDDDNDKSVWPPLGCVAALSRFIEGQAPAQSQAPAGLSLSSSLSSSFSIEAFVARHFPEAKPQPYNGGTKWVLEVCPFNPDHNDRSAVITQSADGALGFRCHHNGCTGHDWHALRELLEPATVSLNLGAIVRNAQPQTAPSVVPPPPEKPAPLWSLASTETVNEALRGTLLGRVADLFSQVTDPPLPLSMTLPKAIFVVSCALSRRKPSDECAPNQKGIALARLWLDTAGGQALNTFCMLAAPSGSGKDIGNLDDLLLSQRKLFIGTAGSAEGLADAYIEKGNGGLKISEMQPYLDERKWQHSASVFLTEGFNKGFFCYCLSTRTTAGKQASRTSNYCYPNILASIQPDIFMHVARQADIENGFLSRFIYFRADAEDRDPGIFDRMKTLDDLETILDLFMRKKGRVAIPPHYARDLRQELKRHAPDNLISHINRLCNEYYPRLAVMLSVTENAATHTERVTLCEQDWEHAKTLVRYLYRNAHSLLTYVDEADENVLRLEKVAKRILGVVKRLDMRSQGLGCSYAEISRGGLNRTSGDERKKALRELVDRGYVSIDGNLRYHYVSTPEEWR